jgi:TPR repeat protein
MALEQQFALSSSLRRGRGVPVDEAAADDWFHKASDHGLTFAKLQAYRT